LVPSIQDVPVVSWHATVSFGPSFMPAIKAPILSPKADFISSLRLASSLARLASAFAWPDFSQQVC
jgi:hypothetical protein